MPTVVLRVEGSVDIMPLNVTFNDGVVPSGTVTATTYSSSPDEINARILKPIRASKSVAASSKAAVSKFLLREAPLSLGSAAAVSAAAAASPPVRLPLES